MRLERDFYRQDGISLAKTLLGKIIVHNKDGVITKCRITETEAYMGENDKASHAYNNLRSKRTETMFHDGGTAYVYMIYGMYYCMNVVANINDIPEAVLIRGAQATEGTDIMKKRRKTDKIKNLCSGPGKLCMAMGIDKTLDDTDMCESENFYIYDDGYSGFEIGFGKRINIDYAQEAIDFEYRFFIK